MRMYCYISRVRLYPPQTRSSIDYYTHAHTHTYVSNYYHTHIILDNYYMPIGYLG